METNKMPYIAYTRPDGGVNVVRPTSSLIMEFHLHGRATGTLRWIGLPRDVPGAVMLLSKAEETAVAFVMLNGVPPDAANLVVVEDSVALPTRRFRNCWRQSGATVPFVDMPLARTQRMGEIRREREPKLGKVDSDIRAAEDAGAAARVTVLRGYRQFLRDLPAAESPNVERCTTPAQLEAWQPTWPVDPAA